MKIYYQRIRFHIFIVCRDFGKQLSFGNFYIFLKKCVYYNEQWIPSGDRMKTIAFLVCFLVIPAAAQQRGNGDKIDSLPNLSERQLLVLTNACRLAPAQYRDLYIGNYQVLLPANYPAVRPLYGSPALNKSAHAHTLDMAFNCGMQHPSCDGTAWNTRIQSFYNNKSSTIGENIAAGNQTALATVKQWVLEVNPSTTPVPADKDPAGGDGHRKNIMNGGYKELGCGYAKGTQQYTYFWTQDFGGGKPDFNGPLVAGCHLFIETGKITFFVNYYDSSGVVPTGVACTIDGQKNAMTLAIGDESKGTYSLVQTKGAACRQYYFSCLRNGTAYRYPEYGVLVTSGEGSCNRDYIAPESLSVVVSPRIVSNSSRLGINRLGKTALAVSGLSSADYPAMLLITDLRGDVAASQRLSAGATISGFTAPKLCGQGMYIASVKTNDGKLFSRLILRGCP